MLKFIDRSRVFRRLAFIWMIWLTTYAMFWCFDFAKEALELGTELLGVSAVIVAITAPITALQGVVIKLYTDSRHKTGD